jgi:hypothetical protein
MGHKMGEPRIAKELAPELEDLKPTQTPNTMAARDINLKSNKATKWVLLYRYKFR